MKANRDYNEITNVLFERYGVGPLAASPETVLWASEYCQNPKKAIKAINRIRTNHGTSPAYPPYNHVAF